MSKENRYYPGKVDYNDTGKKNCMVEIEWSLKDGKFSMSGSIWNPRKTDIYCGGQCIDTIAKLFPRDKQVQSMLTLWEEWHLNDMTAGSPAQEAWLKEHAGRFEKVRERYRKFQARKKYDWERKTLDHYTWATKALKRAGLNPDRNYGHEGKPYSYGHAWLKREIPVDVLEIIHSWSQTSDKSVLAAEDPFAAWLESLFTYEVEWRSEEDKRDNWRCTFKRKNTYIQESFEYFTGFGHRKDTMGRPWKLINRNNHMGMTYEFSKKKSAPSAKSVVDCLVQDAEAYNRNRDFLDFAEEFGYENVKEARRIWQACEVTYTKLQRLFGSEFHILMDTEKEAA
jgi:hypothetical protein